MYNKEECLPNPNKGYAPALEPQKSSTTKRALLRPTGVTLLFSYYDTTSLGTITAVTKKQQNTNKIKIVLIWCIKLVPLNWF